MKSFPVVFPTHVEGSCLIGKVTHIRRKGGAPQYRIAVVGTLRRQYLVGFAPVSPNTRTFHYNEAYYLRGFSFDGFMTNIVEGNIKVDLRMHMKVDDRVRNHGTAFRIVKSELYNCFDNKLRIL